MDPTRLCGSALGMNKEAVWFWAALRAIKDSRENVREIILATIVWI